MSDASADRSNIVRSLAIWAGSLLAGIIVAWIVGGLLGRGTAPGLVFGAAVFLILPYLLTMRDARVAAAYDAGTAHDHGHAHAPSAAAGHAPTHPHDDGAASGHGHAAAAAAPVAPLAEPVGHAAPLVEPMPAADPVSPVAADPVVPEERAAIEPQPAALADFGAVADAGEPFSERVRDAARAAGEAARALSGDAVAGVGSKPATLAAPRDGAGDNLRRLKGVGPKLEVVLHDLGIWHFDQIASWGPGEIAWLDANLDFPGRVVREDWVGQATILAAGGETEHSQRVDRGEST